jgi:hypothetical protein
MHNIYFFVLFKHSPHQLISKDTKVECHNLVIELPIISDSAYFPHIVGCNKGTILANTSDSNLLQVGASFFQITFYHVNHQ